MGRLGKGADMVLGKMRGAGCGPRRALPGLKPSRRLQAPLARIARRKKAGAFALIDLGFHML